MTAHEKHYDEQKEMSARMELDHACDKQLENAFNHVHAFQILEELQPVVFEQQEVPDQQINDQQFQLAQQGMNVG